MSQLVISLTILLIPGIVATLIFDAITEHTQWNNFIFSVSVVLFGWLSYLPLWLWNKISRYYPFLPQAESVRVFTKLENSTLSDNIYSEILAASIFAVLFAYVISCCVNHKWLTKTANRLGISDKYGDENLFYYYLNEWNKTKNKDEILWLSVRDFCQNRIYTGGLGAYSEQDGIQELVLTDVNVYEKDAESYHLANIYLCGKIGSFSIEPLTRENSNV